MLIVSQDKKIVVNFSQAQGIWACNNGEKYNARIFFEGDEEEFMDIAEYQTKDRAIEVLSDLAAAYEHGAKVFEMPKE